MPDLLGVYGVSGFGREVMSVVRQQVGAEFELVFIDDGQAGQGRCNGQPVVGWDAFLTLPGKAREVTIAIADSAVRQRLARRCAEAGVPLFTVKAPNVFVGDEVTIGEGAIVQPFVTLTASAVIGRCFHANIYSYVAHDCVVGDFVTFAPAVRCNGNVTIGDGAYIGTGAILRQGKPGQPLTIGAGAVVGMGAVVLKDVAAGETVIGNPARPLVRAAPA